MKKKILTSLAAFLILSGCATTANRNIKPISMKSISLLDKYGINESSLMKTKNGYMFVIPVADGIAVYRLDSKYNLISRKTTPVMMQPVKSEIKNQKLYVLGYDQKNNRPVLLIYTLNGELKSKRYYGKKFDLARDFTFINGHIYVALTNYGKNTSSDIVIYSDNGKTITFSTPKMEDVKFIEPYKKGILIIGTMEDKSEDVLIVYKTLSNKTVWAKKLDMGMDEEPSKVTVNNGVITLTVVSTDNMGAEKDVTFKIDSQGNIKSVKKGIEFKQLPTKYRT